MLLTAKCLAEIFYCVKLTQRYYCIGILNDSETNWEKTCSASMCLSRPECGTQWHRLHTIERLTADNESLLPVFFCAIPSVYGILFVNLYPKLRLFMN